MKLYTIEYPISSGSNGWYLKNITVGFRVGVFQGSGPAKSSISISHCQPISWHTILGTESGETVKPVHRKTLSFRLISMFIVGPQTDEVQRKTPIIMV